MENRSLEVGNRVRLEGAERLKGIIISHDLRKSEYRVRWDNGRTGTCKAEDLEVITQPVRA